MPVAIRWFLSLLPLNPIAVRLIQNASRRRKHLYVRAGYLAVLILVLLWILIFEGGAGGAASYRELAQAGASSFTLIAYLQIGLICILSPVFMASAIAQEANPKTWDILLTTPLGAAQIVLGNLIGRLYFILALLLASLPLFALTQYFGGVPGNAIFSSYLVAGCTALVVGAVAIALSVSRLAGRRSVFAFYVAVVTYLALTATADAIVRTRGGGAAGGNGVTWFTGINPFLSLSALLNPRTYPRADAAELSGLRELFLARPITAFCVLSANISVVLLAISTFTVRAGGLQTLAGTRSTKRVPWYRRMMGLGAANAEFRPPRTVGMNPIAWREATARNATFWRILGRWSFVAAGAAIGVVVIILFHRGTLNARDFRLTLQGLMWMEAAVISLIAINTAATAVSREREDGTLDLLLTTPMTPAVYLAGKLKGLVASLLPLILVPVGTLTIAGLYVLFKGFGRPGGVDVRATGGAAYPVILPEAGLITLLTLLPFTAFCVMVGLQWSLKSKGTIGSVVGTVGVVGVVAAIVGFCGWRSGVDIGYIGPALAATGPFSALFAVIAPETAMFETVSGSSDGYTSARVALLIGAAIAAGIYFLIVAGIRASMVKGFDFTVRKLAGTR